MAKTTNVDYSKTTAPDDYKCKNCGATGIKLWREYQTFNPQLLCAKCAAQSQKKDIRDMDADGLHTEDDLGIRTDSIGWYVPAIPDEEGLGYWGYTSVPDAGIKWWKNLPTLV